VPDEADKFVSVSDTVTPSHFDDPVPFGEIRELEKMLKNVQFAITLAEVPRIVVS